MFPRSRLFRSEVRHDATQVRMVSISVDELFRLATEYESKKSISVNETKKVRKMNPSWDLEEMDTECDFSVSLSF